jgi:translation initiation factor 3 subunit I
VSLSFGEKEIFTLSDYQKVSTIRVFDFEQVLRKKEDEPAKMILQIDGKKDVTFNHAVWGPLNKTIYVATTTGEILIYDLQGNIIKERELHKEEIFQLFLSHDFTMLVTSSRDGHSKILNPETLEEVRVFKYGSKPCRGAVISPLFDDRNHQKFHIAVVGGQEARDVARMNIEGSGFEIQLYSIIYEQKLAEIGGHFGPVHTIDFSPDGFAFATGSEDGYVHYHQLPPEYFTKKFE